MVLADIDLPSMMRGLYEGDGYFISIDPRSEMVFEDGYHGTTVDPDGNVRERLSERERALASMTEILGFFESRQPGKVLDIGCGLGWLLSWLGKDWEKHGVEVSKLASDHASQFGDVYHGRLEEYVEDRGNQVYDCIVFYHVIEHLPDPISAVETIFSLLKPGGTLIIGTPDFDCAMARKFGSRFRLLHDPTHISLFSFDSLTRLLRDTGFKINNVEFPFFGTQWENEKNLLAAISDGEVSPPFYGNTMTFFCRKPELNQSAIR